MRATLAVIGLALLAGCTPPPAPIAVIDLQVIARALGRDDVMSQQITVVNETLRQQLQSAAEQLREQLQAEQDALGDDATDEDQQRFDQLLSTANQRLEESQRTVQLRSSQFQQAVVADFRREVTAIAREIAASEGAQAVLLSTNTSLLWYDSTIDITEEVIARMRERDKQGGGTNTPASQDAVASEE
ncbi:MAG: OmpH family outer membrane protein [Pseudomonadota bacterium]